MKRRGKNANDKLWYSSWDTSFIGGKCKKRDERNFGKMILEMTSCSKQFAPNCPVLNSEISVFHCSLQMQHLKSRGWRTMPTCPAQVTESRGRAQNRRPTIECCLLRHGLSALALENRGKCWGTAFGSWSGFPCPNTEIQQTGWNQHGETSATGEESVLAQTCSVNLPAYLPGDWTAPLQLDRMPTGSKLNKIRADMRIMFSFLV